MKNKVHLVVITTFDRNKHLAFLSTFNFYFFFTDIEQKQCGIQRENKKSCPYRCTSFYFLLSTRKTVRHLTGDTVMKPAIIKSCARAEVHLLFLLSPFCWVFLIDFLFVVGMVDRLFFCPFMAYSIVGSNG